MLPVSSPSRREEPAAAPTRSNGERGQVLILAVVAITVVLVIGVITVDVGMWLSGRASVVNAVDQATMAGSLYLPKDGATAETVAKQYVQENDPDIGDVEVTFRCIVGDRDGDGQPDSGDIPAVCPQLKDAPFTCINGLCYANCDFTGTAKCNTIVVKGSKDVPFGFGPIFGLNEGAAAGFVSAACRGACGGPPTAPLDLVEIIDRTYSMSSTDLTNAKNGARAVLELYNPEVQRVALATLPQSLPTNDCTAVAKNSDPGNWTLTPLLSDYKNPDGSLNTSSEIVSDINCLQRSALWSPPAQTDLGSPTKAATELLINTGRPDVKWGIILLTDGQANMMPLTGSGYLNCGANAPVTTSGNGDRNGYEVTPANACADGGGEAQDLDSGTGTSTSCDSTYKDRHVFYNYNIPNSIPNLSTSPIKGIEVRLDARVDLASGTRNLCVQLSWNGGTSWTTASSDYRTSNLGTSQGTYILGSDLDNWNHNWTASELSNANFRVRVTDVSSNNSRDFYLDWVAVQVYTWPPTTQYKGPCDYAAKQAAAAKTLDPPIEIFTIGYGIENMDCDSSSGELSSSPYYNQRATTLLADMATDSLDDHNHCRYASDIAAENADGDNFLCEAQGSDLEPIFRAAAEALASGSRLVSIPF